MSDVSNLCPELTGGWSPVTTGTAWSVTIWRVSRISSLIVATSESNLALGSGASERPVPFLDRSVRSVGVRVQPTSGTAKNCFLFHSGEWWWSWLLITVIGTLKKHNKWDNITGPPGTSSTLLVSLCSWRNTQAVVYSGYSWFWKLRQSP